VDVVYQTRVQKERFSDTAEFEQARRAIRIDAALMRTLRESAVVMHPLPRVDEIAPEVDADPRAAYFRQARNGVAIRMAVLEALLQLASSSSPEPGRRSCSTPCSSSALHCGWRTRSSSTMHS